jgi:2-oxoglutarate ferredoxin oxidoreductase subunit delta
MSKHVTIDFEKCKGCWLCIEPCPSELFKQSNIKNERGYNAIQMINPNFCLGNDCLKCVKICPDNALNNPDESPDKLAGVFYWLGNKLSKNIIDRKSNKK